IFYMKMTSLNKKLTLPRHLQMSSLSKKLSWRPITAIVTFIGLWELLTRMLEIETWVLPAPSIIMIEMWEVFPDFYPHMLSTVKLVMIGFSLGTLIGLATATILHHAEKIRETFYPF